GAFQFEIDARHRKVRDNVVREPADAVNWKGHDDVRFDAQYFIANRLLDRPWIELLQSAIGQVQDLDVGEIERRSHVQELATAGFTHLFERPPELVPNLGRFAVRQGQQID